MAFKRDDLRAGDFLTHDGGSATRVTKTAPAQVWPNSNCKTLDPSRPDDFMQRSAAEMAELQRRLEEVRKKAAALRGKT